MTGGALGFCAGFNQPGCVTRSGRSTRSRGGLALTLGCRRLSGGARRGGRRAFFMPDFVDADWQKGGEKEFLENRIATMEKAIAELKKILTETEAGQG